MTVPIRSITSALARPFERGRFFACVGGCVKEAARIAVCMCMVKPQFPRSVLQGSTGLENSGNPPKGFPVGRSKGLSASVRKVDTRQTGKAEQRSSFGGLAASGLRHELFHYSIAIIAAAIAFAVRV